MMRALEGLLIVVLGVALLILCAGAACLACGFRALRPDDRGC